MEGEAYHDRCVRYLVVLVVGCMDEFCGACKESCRLKLVPDMVGAA